MPTIFAACVPLYPDSSTGPTPFRRRHRRSYVDVRKATLGPIPAPVKRTCSGEVVGVDVLDEVAELVEDLLRLLLGLRRRLLADLVEELLGGEQRRLAAHGQGDGVRGTARQHRDLASGAAQVELREVGVVTHLGDDDLLELDAELGQGLDEEVVGQRT